MNKKETLPLIYIIGLPIALIIASSIAHIHIKIAGAPLYLYAFIYPLTYLISCLIVKKANYKKGLVLMAIALITQTMVFVLQWVLFNKFDAYLMICTFLSFLIEQLILIYTYDFLIKIKKDTFFPITLLILFISIVSSIFFGACIEGQCISLSILPRIIYVIVIPALIAKNTNKKEK